jgi:hypothetical protein
MENEDMIDADFIASVVKRWRGATVNRKGDFDDGLPQLDDPAVEEISPLQQTPRNLHRLAPDKPGAPVGADAFFFPVDDGTIPPLSRGGR